MRIADLYDELTNPTPRGFEKWFERKSGVRYVMMATIAGVLFAIFLGMASLGLGVIRHGLGINSGSTLPHLDRMVFKGLDYSHLSRTVNRDR